MTALGVALVVGGVTVIALVIAWPLSRFGPTTASVTGVALVTAILTLAATVVTISRGIVPDVMVGPLRTGGAVIVGGSWVVAMVVLLRQSDPEL